MWFAADEDTPLVAVSGIWMERTSVREKSEGEITTDALGFPTTHANGGFETIHSKAMPVLLTEPEEFDVGMRADCKGASAFQRLLPGDVPKDDARSHRSDGQA